MPGISGQTQSIHIARLGACRLGAFRLGFVNEDLRMDGNDAFYKWTEKKIGAADTWVTKRK